jgi:hypothetical protein
VVDKEQPKGFGVQPEVFAGPTVEAIRKNRDYKTEAVVELIKSRKDTCITGVVTYAGDPLADGLGWVISVGDEKPPYIVGDRLPVAYRAEGTKVQACVYKTGAKAPCHCITPPDGYGIRRIKRSSQ